MKRIIYILSFVLLVCSCSDKFLEKDAPGHIRQYNCVIRENSTKTFIDSNLSQSWSAGDEISVFSDTYNREFVFQGKDGDKSGFFTEKPQDFEFYTSWEIDGTVAVYPYNPATAINEDRHVSLYMPEVQEYHVNTYDPAANIMVAYNTSENDENLTFHNMCGYLAVPVSSSIIAKKVTLTANCAVAGWSDILFSDSGPEIKVRESGSNTITIDCGQGIALSENESEPTMFIFAIPPVILEEGFTVEVEDVSGWVYSKTTDKSREIVSNGYVQMETWKFAPYEVKTFCYPGTDTPAELEYYDRDIFWAIDRYSLTMTYVEFEDGWHCALTPIDGKVDETIFPLRFIWNRTSGESIEQPVYVETQGTNLIHPVEGMFYLRQSNMGESYFDGDRTFYLLIEYYVSLGSYGSGWSTIKIRTEDDNPITIPDPAFRRYCLDNFDTDNDKEISVEEARNVYEMVVDTKDIESLEGIGEFVNLKYLNCSLSIGYYQRSVDGTIHCFDSNGNEISGIKSLDLSKNTELILLDCCFNQLSSLDLSNNPKLERLYCYGNSLVSLDVSKNPNLTELDCHDNNLSYIDVSQNSMLRSFLCHSNKLTSLDLSNNVGLINLNCTGNQLTNLDLSKNTELYNLICSNNQLTGIDVSNSVALGNLYCIYNQISSLDLSKNVDLVYLDCSENQLTNLDLSKNTELLCLICNNNQLTDIDVTNSVALNRLNCNYNQLPSLDVSKNTMLGRLYCSNNQLTSLDVSNNTVLSIIECESNQLESLVLGNNTRLGSIICDNNKLTTLDVSGNSGLTSLSCKYNPSLSEIWLAEGQTIRRSFKYDEGVTIKYKNFQ